MAEVIAGVGTSHTPAIGAAVDHGRTGEPYWQPVFAGYARAREWIADLRPDVAIIVYNDHASAFSLEVIPTFAIGVAPEFPPRPTRGTDPAPSRWCTAHRTSPGTSPSR